MADPDDTPQPDPRTDAPADAAQASDGPALGAVPPEEEGAPVSGPTPDDGAGLDGPDPEDAGTPDADGDPDPLAELRAERDSYLDQLLRARADYENLNKRRHKEVAEARDRGAAAVVEALLEVLDNFGFALQAAEASEDTQLAKGVQLVHDQLIGVLEQAGLAPVPGEGAVFDPAHHEALVSERDDDGGRDEPEVAEVLRTGYRFKSQLLRPASVRVVE
ncbi:nucleotide exchange factor GrpE [Euzebya sp.]|uniref:nucleotide exchange factor GrpE n=1 Tax=Euzebya sp. TaxID=1971409 RepID=UPI003513CD00